MIIFLIIYIIGVIIMIFAPIKIMKWTADIMSDLYEDWPTIRSAISASVQCQGWNMKDWWSEMRVSGVFISLLSWIGVIILIITTHYEIKRTKK